MNWCDKRKWRGNNESSWLQFSCEISCRKFLKRDLEPAIGKEPSNRGRGYPLKSEYSASSPCTIRHIVEGMVWWYLKETYVYKLPGLTIAEKARFPPGSTCGYSWTAGPGTINTKKTNELQETCPWGCQKLEEKLQITAMITESWIRHQCSSKNHKHY